MLSRNEEEQLLSLIKDNNKMLQDIWNFLYRGKFDDDFKDFIINVIANKISQV